MGSFKRNGQSQGPNRRRNKSNTKRHGFLVGLEPLESRRLLSGSGSVGESNSPLWTPTDTNLFDAQNGPMANLGVQLVDIYKAYVDGDGNAAALPAEFPGVEFQNGMVGTQLKMLGGDFSQYVSQLTDVGMQVTASSAYYAVVDGYVPVNELPTVAELSQTQSGTANYYPIAQNTYQGEADNEAEASTFSDVAQTQFNVTGTGVTVGGALDERQSVQRRVVRVLWDRRPECDQSRQRRPGCPGGRRGRGRLRRRPRDAGEHPRHRPGCQPRLRHRRGRRRPRLRR